MITQEQIDRFQYQQTEAGQKTIQAVENLKQQYCMKLGIPFSQIKTGKLKPLVNGNTGEIDRFIEE